MTPRNSRAELLRHYSDTTVSVVHSCAQIAHPAMKPTGFWFSVDSCEDNWRAWCESNEFELDRLAVVHDVQLRPQARILRLSGSADLLVFTDQYRAPKYPGSAHLEYFAIEWARVAEKWQGIIITPYVWNLRLDSRVSWYYGWDCASGCVWDAEAVASVQPIMREAA